MREREKEMELLLSLIFSFILIANLDSFALIYEIGFARKREREIENVFLTYKEWYT